MHEFTMAHAQEMSNMKAAGYADAGYVLCNNCCDCPNLKPSMLLQWQQELMNLS
jgi:hypothetical protein